MRRIVYPLLLLGLVGFFVWQTWDLWNDTNPKPKIVNGREFDVKTVIQTPLAAIHEFPIDSIDEAAANVADEDLVLGVVVNGQARGYPLSQLTGSWREILNDRLGGVPIAATW